MSPTAPRRCAFLTLQERGDFCIYDHLLFEPLGERGWQVEEIPWDRVGVDWSEFEAVIIRSTWDYQGSLTHFLATLEGIESVTRLFNTVAVCRWNSNKRYLAELQQRGVTIVPTNFCVSPQPGDLHAAFDRFATDRLVVKPAIGANADDTFVLDRCWPQGWEEALQTHKENDSLIQPFLNTILSEGEYSLFYFGGRFSHAILKQPAEGDFRVQEEHGGHIRLIEATGPLLATGDRCMDAIEHELLYGRVDLLRLPSGEFAVMEVELIEPSLYFDQDPAAAARFARIFEEVMNAE